MCTISCFAILDSYNLKPNHEILDEQMLLRVDFHHYSPLTLALGKGMCLLTDETVNFSPIYMKRYTQCFLIISLGNNTSTGQGHVPFNRRNSKFLTYKYEEIRSMFLVSK